MHLPLSWDDPATRLAIRKYMTSVRPDAPWCPSNIEFIRRINGLDSVDEVRRIVYDASYLVLGLGDVYLGAPVATPLDPRHRLVTTKYNPARTWTPENAVGIGGAYLCVYGMEGPGGYQFVGRTCQIWNRFHETADFPAGRPWLLRFFDQLRFYPMGERELLAFRAAFTRGRVQVETEPTTFRFADYRRFLDDNSASIDELPRASNGRPSSPSASAGPRCRRRRGARRRAPAAGADRAPRRRAGDPLARHRQRLGDPGAVGARVGAGDRLVVLETMKMETPVVAPRAAPWSPSAAPPAR